MNTAGWCENTTTPTRKARWINETLNGTDTLSPPSAAGSANAWRTTAVRTAALMSTATAAFQPKVLTMNVVSHAQVDATIRTGGAPKLVKVPPMETFTKRTP